MFNRFKSDLEKIFDGLVLSYEIQMIKPYELIYKYLLKEYNLNVEESLFVDDKEAMLNEYGIVLDK